MSLISRALPSNLEAEQAVLSSILSNNRNLEKVIEFLRYNHFTHPAHQEIYKLAEKQFERGIPFDIVTVKNYLEQQGILETVGGINYLTELSSVGSNIPNMDQYAKIVYDNSIRRDLINLGQDIENNAYLEDLDNPVSNQIELAEKKLFDLAVSGTTDKGPISISSSLKDALEEIEIAYKADGKLSGLTTGFSGLDQSISGLHKSDLIIIAGRPGMGKTAFATNIAVNAASAIFSKRANEKYKGVVVFFSLEMSSSQLATRVLSSQSRIPTTSMRSGNLVDEDFAKMSQYSDGLSRLPLIFDDTPGISVPMIRTRARRLARQFNGISLIVIDYLQLITPAGGRRSDNRVQEISEITRGLKILAKELEVPVIALSQLSRNVESKDRSDKKPQLSDLRESGSIEQDADIVMFTYREEYYLKDRDPKDKISSRSDLQLNKESDEWKKKYEASKGKAEIIIGKNRHGKTESIKLLFKGEYSLFEDEDNTSAPVINEKINNDEEQKDIDIDLSDIPDDLS